ncbi:MAG TPA: hypothetical protein VH518_09070 [Tepidisphaeraceae bacterium]|jgi:hypothetical protein
MFDFWFELPPMLRAGLGVLLLIIGGVLFFVTGGLVFIGLGAVGLMFILFCNAGKDKGGYNF